MISDQAFVLHKRPYKDSSELIKLLTKSHGIVDVICKGSRRPKSKFKGQLQPFIHTAVAYAGRSSLKTLIQAEQVTANPACAYLNHVSMLYCNELMLLMNLDEEAVSVLFPIYTQTIARLFEAQQVSLILRQFEWQLCCELGYELCVPVEADNNDVVWFNPENGLELTHNKNGCSVAAFEQFNDGAVLSQQQQLEINQLMKAVVNHMVHGKTIQSRELLLFKKR